MLTIREATPEDAPAVADMYTRAWQAAYRGLLADAYLDALDAGEQASKMCVPDCGSLALSRDYPQFAAYVAIGNGRILGWCFSGPASAPEHTESGEIYALYVDPDHLGKGTGKRLFNAAARHIQAEGYDALYADALVGNTIAHNFYTRLKGRSFTNIADKDVGGTQVACRRYYWPLICPS